MSIIGEQEWDTKMGKPLQSCSSVDHFLPCVLIALCTEAGNRLIGLGLWQQRVRLSDSKFCCALCNWLASCGLLVCGGSSITEFASSASRERSVPWSFYGRKLGGLSLLPVGELLNQALSSTVSAYRPVKRDLLVQLPLVTLRTVRQILYRDVNLTSLYKICLTVNITSTCQ